jgi:hypothetical protein
LLALRKKTEQAPERHLHLQQYKDKSISAGYNPLLPVSMNDNQYGSHPHQLITSLASSPATQPYSPLYQKRRIPEL